MQCQAMAWLDVVTGIPINFSNWGTKSINFMLVHEIKTISIFLPLIVYFTPVTILLLSIDATTGSRFSLNEPNAEIL